MKGGETIPRIIGCPNCGSEKIYGRKCSSCLDLNDEEWAIKDAVDAYVVDAIDIKTLEKKIELALTNPPKRSHNHYFYS